MGQELAVRVWELPLSYQHKFTLMALAYQADDNTGHARVSINEVAKIMGAGRSTVYRCVQALERRNYLTIRRDRHGYYARYTLALARDEPVPAE